jgi:putative aldouronate transport system permease protein
MERGGHLSALSKGNLSIGLEPSFRKSLGARLRSDFKRNRIIYLMMLPVVAYYFIFYYIPMYGAQIAFRDFSPGKGIYGSDWVGLKNFIEFFKSYYFVRLIRNTFLLNVYDIVFGFPIPIILALLLNELKVGPFKRTVQTVTYLPHFISIVVLSGMILDFASRTGLFNTLLGMFGVKPIIFLTESKWFPTVFVGSGIWQEFGWGSIIYLAALSNIDPQLYEAARVDGANRWQQTLHITLPGILATIAIMLILRCGRMMNVGAEKILLLYNPMTYETADVISSFIYRKGLIENDFSYSSAVGLFNSMINFVLLLTVNKVSKKASGTGLF